MMFKDIVHLLVMGKVKEDGVTVEGEISRRTVFADSRSIGMQEFYLSSQSGFSPTVTLEIRLIDYQEESVVEFKGKKYNVIRTYEKGDNIELKCQRRGGSA
ncbi:phage head-tail adapter protein [Priestia endophytica]|uniref:phage head-tail adapter protein n=1 Tax=Priestia endophytica TaxID=135735 RepID=UPI00203DE83B|nr:phage head-tail adapter protein [Priestia endophytica]MCM3536592.1 phage head-tail adapter protein [Priestia endophytica]